jgi:hypothetical protein
MVQAANDRPGCRSRTWRLSAGENAAETEQQYE